MLMEDFYREGFTPTESRLLGYDGEALDAPTLGFSKIDILYVQMQKVASLFPGQKVVFHFYDDCHGIMNALNIFYSSHSDLIPSNMTLVLHHIGRTSLDTETDLHKRTKENLVKGNSWNYNFATIEGTGEACFDYNKLLEKLQEIAEEIRDTQTKGLPDPTAKGLVTFLKSKRGISVEKEAFSKRRGSAKKRTPPNSGNKPCCVVM